MSQPQSLIGRQLWQLIPQLYRTQDAEQGHLSRYLDAFGELFDRYHETLEQRLADCFPDVPESGRSCQDWVLPYLGDLLDVELHSPHADGRRTEVARAVRWRKRKGTIQGVEEIAEAIAQSEVVTHEGWRRVARTPSIATPLLPASAFGVSPEPNAANPSESARHPGLPAMMVDLSRASRAVRADAAHPLATPSHFHGEQVLWRQGNPHGAPCFPGSYEDASVRTVDVRDPDHRRGHAHPDRALLFAPPPLGFFELDDIESTWEDRGDHPSFFEESDVDGVVTLRNPSLEGDAEPGVEANGLRFSNAPPPFTEERRYVVRGLHFIATPDAVEFQAGEVELENLAIRHLVIDIPGATADDIVLRARNCLFESVTVVRGTAELEYCTVMERLEAPRVQASDCLFANEVQLNPGAGDAPSCIRYSRISADVEALPETTLQHAINNTTDVPIFHDFEICQEVGADLHSLDFGSPGHAVLHPATPDSICAGAEDGSEMGAYHHRHHCLAIAAVLRKLADFLPLGLEATFIPDPRLLQAPPAEVTA